MIDESGEWLSAAETRAHVAAAFAKSGHNPDDASGAVLAKAAFGRDTLETALIDSSINGLADSSSYTAWRNMTLRNFWTRYLARPVSTDWLNGDFATEEVSRTVATGRSTKIATESVRRLWVKGVRFRRQQVEALWPLCRSQNFTSKVAVGRPAKANWDDILNRVAQDASGRGNDATSMTAKQLRDSAERLELLSIVPPAWDNIVSKWKRKTRRSQSDANRS
jgi:hypothetical protein